MNFHHFSGTYAAVKIYDEVRIAALAKAAHGLPSRKIYEP